MSERSPSPRLVVITTVPVSFGLVRGQGKFMQSRGFEVQGICSPGDGLDEAAKREHYEIHGIRMERRITPFRDLVALAQLCVLLRRIDPQVVHTHTPKGSLLGMIAAWLARVPVRIYQIQGLPLQTATGTRRWILWWSERVSCLLATQVLCISHSLRKVVIAEGVCRAPKIKVLRAGSGNGVDALGRFNPEAGNQNERRRLRQALQLPDDAPVVGFVGRIVRDKGLVELAAAWAGLRLRFPDAHLLLIGPVESQDPVPAEVVAALEADPRVQLLGAVADTAAYFRAIDLLVLPTYREGFGNVLLEASSMELPVVATRIAGCIDAVQEGVTGLLVPPHDATALAEAIERYLRDPDLRRQHGQAGRARVLRDFRQEAIWEALYEEYLRLLHEKGVRFSKGAC